MRLRDIEDIEEEKILRAVKKEEIEEGKAIKLR